MGNNFIKEVSIGGLLSFDKAAFELELKPLNVLIGANGSGKSNFLEVINLIYSAANNRLSKTMANQGGIPSFFWRGDESQISVMTIKTDNIESGDETSLYYGINLRCIKGELNIDFESVRRTVGSREYLIKRTDKRIKYSKFDMPDSIAIESYQSILGRQYSTDSIVYKFIEDLRRCSNTGFFKEITPSVLKEPNQIGEWSNNLQSDLKNLALVVNKLDLEGDFTEKIMPKLQDVYENIEEIRAFSMFSTIKLFYREKGSKNKLPIDRISDGLLRFFTLLVILYQPDPPPVICIDEPEIGLHPEVIPKLAECLIEASKRTQIIITTHSADLVDALSEVPESVIVCEREGGAGTKMKRLDKENLSEWLENYSLGEIWLKGEIGGTRY